MKKSVISLALFVFILGSTAGFTEEPSKEYMLKAAFLYKFFFFADWPEKTFYESESTIVLGIMGENHFGDVFKKIEGESIHGRRLTVKRLGNAVRPEMLRGCQILFINRSFDKETRSILASLKGHPVLTVGETATFVESGGVISFVAKEDSIGFEISQTAAERAGIKIRAQLLRVAARVIEE
ncbi:MAG: hypothetical protein C0403_17235 [Desulfobacterium sp.]|nr:hypothetical protein [Desulfobacterium sp.]